jgi:two-component system NtrC family sensor kinase
VWRLYTSIRKKIVLAFILNFFFISSIAIITIFNLVSIERRLDFNAIISEFLDSTLELRRFEKNYFLYRNNTDFNEAMSYVTAIETTIKNHKKDFDKSSLVHYGAANHFGENKMLSKTGAVSERILNLTSDYRRLLKKARGTHSDFERLEEQIREKGRELTETAEKLDEAERTMIQDMFSATRRHLIVFGALFIIGISLIGKLISTIAIKPLQELETSMTRISSGNFEMLSLSSKSDEIISINKAFNRMMKELFTHRDIIRAEKLTSLGTMLAGIAHEINNPLSNISTSAEILSEEINTIDTEFIKELINQIVKETDRARDIVRSVLEFTRDREFRKKEENLLNLVSETMRFVRSDIPSYITLTIDIPETLTVRVDKQTIQHAILNLIKNSIDAIPDRGAEERIIIRAEDNEQNGIRIHITDTGMGIPETIIERIFDPFYSTKDIGRGTGLGLFITYNIIEQHGGTLHVRSKLGEGSTFTITLPSKGEND